MSFVAEFSLCPFTQPLHKALTVIQNAELIPDYDPGNYVKKRERKLLSDLPKQGIKYRLHLYILIDARERLRPA